MMGGNEDNQGNVYEMLRPTRDVRCLLDDTLIMHRTKKGVLDMQGGGMMRVPGEEQVYRQSRITTHTTHLIHISMKRTIFFHSQK